MRSMRLLLLLPLLSLTEGLTYDPTSHCYHDLLVALSPDLPQQDWSQLKPGLEAWLTAGSRLLHTATHGWAYLCNVRVLLPASWSKLSYTVTAASEVHTDAEVWVEGWNSLHGSTPFTVQPGECGEAGLYIQVSQTYLANHTLDFSDVFGPPGQVFLHEWAKLRYGVFEEHGYPGDPLYPAFYHQQVWTASGPQVTVKPALCTNLEVEGQMVDLATGQTTQCAYDAQTGLPNDLCIFQATGPEGLDSSVMAVPYLKGNDHFCEEGEEHIHHHDLPNKHNAMCGGRSVFEVVKQHPDFVGYEAQPAQNNPIPTLTYLQAKPTQKYVMVLDASCSMGHNEGENKCLAGDGDRIDKLKKAATRFLTYGLEDNVPLGVVKFSANTPQTTTTVFPLAPINDTNRDVVIKVINDITLDLQTCLGDGVRKGLDAIKEYDGEEGGVMLFLTDGRFTCPTNGITGPTIGDVIDEVVDQSVRVITVAFGDKADPDLEVLAEKTDGDSFYVPDNSGPGDLNNAFSATMDYQPEGSYTEKFVNVLQETISGQRTIEQVFLIDQFSGREVVLELDIISTQNVQIEVPEANITHTFTPAQEVFQRKFENLSQGKYTIKLTSSQAMAKVSLKVQSRAPAGSLPLTTTCWTSMGARDVSLQEEDKVVVMADVRQGQSPVVGARVVAVVDRDDDQQPIELVLLDNGAGADRIAGDGLYSTYFTSFRQSATDARYGLSCRVVGSQDTSLHQGSSSRRGLPSLPSPGHPTCCGSTTLREDSILQPTGEFYRAVPGGLISVLQTTGVDVSNIYRPGKISDLNINKMDFDSQTFSLAFTFPGGDLDQGTVSAYQVFYSDNMTLLAGEDDLPSRSNITLLTEDKLNCNNCSMPSPSPAQEKAALEVSMETFPKDRQIYWRVRVEDEGKKWSLSNMASCYLVMAPQTGSSASQIASTMMLMLPVFWLVNIFA